MVDQNSQFYAILTNVGAAKQANADALGIPWKITQLGVGDANGLDPTPNASQISLINEWRRAPLNQLKVDDKDSSIIVAEQVIPAEVGGRWIREIALYDADGDMVAVANCPPTYKPLLNQGSGRTQVVRMNLVVSTSSNVELKIDPSVVLATREWVTSELAKQDFKHSALVATTASIALTGLQTIDGIALTAGARVLVKNQTDGKDNGLYTVAPGAWARCSDADNSAEVTPGLLVLVERGTVNGDSAWQLVTDAPITLGTTALVFEMAFGRTGVSENTYRSVTVDKYGRVVAGTNPTTAAGYGLTDVYTKIEMNALLGSYGIGQASEPTETDLNKYTTPGNFITPQSGLTNLPAGWSPSTRYSLVVAGYGASRYLVQTLTTGLPQGVSIAQAQRTMSAAGVWSPWHSVWNSNNAPRQTGPLDLTAAALLNPGSFGVGSAIVTTEVDMNNFQIPGNYLTAASGLLNMPPGWNASQRHSMVVDGLGPSGHLVQTLTAGLAGGEPKQAIRTFTSGKTWTDWEEVATGRHLPIRGRVMYRNAGVYQWTVPPGVTKVDVEVRGGGGSGGFGTQDTGSGGGGGGGISKRLCTVTPGAVITVTVGAGGAAVSTVGASGNAGGASSFGSFCSATGGSGGSSGSGAGGGYGAGGDFNASLGSGNPALRNAPGTYALGGSGGGGESIFATNNSTAPSQPGMGGGGRTSTQSQPGADGCVIITY